MKFPLFVFFLSLSCFSIEKIQVHGQKIEPEKLSDHHFVQTFNQQDLAPFNHLEDLIQRTPGLTSSGGTNRARFIQIRGIGERSSYEGMPNESINLFLDEIDYTGFASVLNTAGIEQIKIYKGPQNTSSGAAALGGSIYAESMRAKDPKYQQDNQQDNYYKNHPTQGKISIANFNTQEVGLNQSFSDLSSLTLNYNKSDGYFQNKFLNRDDTNKREEFTLKHKLTFKTIEWNLHYFDFNSGYDVFNLDNNKETFSDHPGQDNQRSLGTSLIHDAAFSLVKLKSIATASRHDSFYSYDEDWENSDSYDYRIEFTKKMQSFSIEERLEWQTPLFFHRSGIYFKNDHQSSLEYGYNGLLPRKILYASYQRRRTAVYHESEFESLNGLTYFMGGRYSTFDSSYSDNNGISVSPTETLWGGQLGVKSIRDDSKWSARIAKGFKAGGLNIGTNIDASRRSFQDEALYSIDLVYQYFNGFFSLDLNAFYTHRKDIQVKTSYQDNPSDPSSFTFYNDNATSGKSYGFEWTTKWEILSNYRVHFGGQVMQTSFGNYQYGTRTLTNREFAYAPNYKLHASQVLEWNSNLKFESHHTATDSFYFGNSHNESSPKSIVTDISISWKWFSIWSQNIFNERTESRGFFFGNRPPYYSDEKFVHIGPPRTFGITGRVNF